MQFLSTIMGLAAIAYIIQVLPFQVHLITDNIKRVWLRRLAFCALMIVGVILTITVLSLIGCAVGGLL